MCTHFKVRGEVVMALVVNLAFTALLPLLWIIGDSRLLRFEKTRNSMAFIHIVPSARRAQMRSDGAFSQNIGHLLLWGKKWNSEIFPGWKSFCLTKAKNYVFVFGRSPKLCFTTDFRFTIFLSPGLDSHKCVYRALSVAQSRVLKLWHMHK